MVEHQQPHPLWLLYLQFVTGAVLCISLQVFYLYKTANNSKPHKNALV